MTSFDKVAKQVPGHFIISGKVGGRKNRTLGPFGWKEHFLVLTDEVLAVYETPNEPEAQFPVNNKSPTIHVRETVMEVQQPNSFCVTYQQTDHYFQTPSEKEYLEWLYALKPFSFKEVTSRVITLPMLPRKITAPLPPNRPMRSNACIDATPRPPANIFNMEDEEDDDTEEDDSTIDDDTYETDDNVSSRRFVALLAPFFESVDNFPPSMIERPLDQATANTLFIRLNNLVVSESIENKRQAKNDFKIPLTVAQFLINQTDTIINILKTHKPGSVLAYLLLEFESFVRDNRYSFMSPTTPTYAPVKLNKNSTTAPTRSKPQTTISEEPIIEKRTPPPVPKQQPEEVRRVPPPVPKSKSEPDEVRRTPPPVPKEDDVRRVPPPVPKSKPEPLTELKKPPPPVPKSKPEPLSQPSAHHRSFSTPQQPLFERGKSVYGAQPDIPEQPIVQGAQLDTIRKSLRMNPNAGMMAQMFQQQPKQQQQQQQQLSYDDEEFVETTNALQGTPEPPYEIGEVIVLPSYVPETRSSSPPPIPVKPTPLSPRDDKDDKKIKEKEEKKREKERKEEEKRKEEERKKEEKRIKEEQKKQDKLKKKAPPVPAQPVQPIVKIDMEALEERPKLEVIAKKPGMAANRKKKTADPAMLLKKVEQQAIEESISQIKEVESKPEPVMQSPVMKKFGGALPMGMPMGGVPMGGIPMMGGPRPPLKKTQSDTAFLDNREEQPLQHTASSDELSSQQKQEKIKQMLAMKGAIPMGFGAPLPMKKPQREVITDNTGAEQVMTPTTPTERVQSPKQPFVVKDENLQNLLAKRREAEKLKQESQPVQEQPKPEEPVTQTPPWGGQLKKFQTPPVSELQPLKKTPPPVPASKAPSKDGEEIVQQDFRSILKKREEK